MKCMSMADRVVDAVEHSHTDKAPLAALLSKLTHDNEKKMKENNIKIKSESASWSWCAPQCPIERLTQSNTRPHPHTQSPLAAGLPKPTLERLASVEARASGATHASPIPARKDRGTKVWTQEGPRSYQAGHKDPMHVISGTERRDDGMTSACPSMR